MRKSKKKRSFLYKLSAFILGLIVAFAALEVLFVLVYFVGDGGYVSVREKLETEEGGSYLRTFDEEHGCAYGDTLTPHPYLGFAQRTVPGCIEINNVGIVGPDFPLENDEDTFVIMLTGGSVAAQIARMKTDSLEQVLNARYGVEGMRFVVLKGALPAWKQPQQLIMLLLYGDAIDAVITLDGFNELVFAYNGQYRYRLENPWEPSILAANPGLASRDQLLAWSLNDWFYGLSRDHWLLSHSKFFYFVGKSARSALRFKASEDSQDLDRRMGQFFEWPADWTYEQRRDRTIQDYRRYVALTEAVAEELGVKSAYFIQPIAAIDKPLTPDEIEVVGDLAYKDDYLLMEKSLLTLQEQGVPVFSLIDTFAHHEGTLYFDPVHQRARSGGYRILVERMVDLLAAEWNLAAESSAATGD